MVLGVLLLLVAVQEGATAQAQRELNLATFDQVWTTVRDRHFDPDLGGVDWEAARHEVRPLAAEAESTQKLRPILSEMLQRLGQSHLGIIPGAGTQAAGVLAEELAPAAQVWDNGCGFAVRIEQGVPLVASVERGSEVEAAGVLAGWRITHVRGQQIQEPCSFTGQVNFPLITAQGDSVTVGFADPAGKGVQVKVPLGSRRGRIYDFPGMPANEVWIESKRLDEYVGYIAFSSFFDPESIMSQFNAAVDSFREMQGIILDVRGNPGGMGSMASAMMSWFVPGEQRTVGSMVSRDSNLEFTLPRRVHYFGGRVAVLIDGASGSSSEIFAAGLRDLGGARLFGKTTAGAVLPSAFDPLPNGDHLQYIVANYVTASGQVLEGVGVAPDVEARTNRTQDAFDDECVTAALEWIYGDE